MSHYEVTECDYCKKKLYFGTYYTDRIIQDDREDSTIFEPDFCSKECVKKYVAEI